MGLIASPFRVVRMEERATVNRTLLPNLVPRLEILLRSPVNLPDWWTLGSIPKNATKALGDLNMAKSPISATSVTAVMNPTPGIWSRRPICRRNLSGKSEDAIMSRHLHGIGDWKALENVVSNSRTEIAVSNTVEKTSKKIEILCNRLPPDYVICRKEVLFMLTANGHQSI